MIDPGMGLFWIDFCDNRGEDDELNPFSLVIVTLVGGLLNPPIGDWPKTDLNSPLFILLIDPMLCFCTMLTCGICLSEIGSFKTGSLSSSVRSMECVRGIKLWAIWESLFYRCWLDLLSDPLGCLHLMHKSCCWLIYSMVLLSWLMIVSFSLMWAFWVTI